MITIQQYVLQYHRRFIPSPWGSKAIQGTLCPLGSQTLKQLELKGPTPCNRGERSSHETKAFSSENQPNKGSQRRRARNQQHKWFQLRYDEHLFRFLASEDAVQAEPVLPTQRDTIMASLRATGPGPKEAHSIWVSNLIFVIAQLSVSQILKMIFHTKHRTLGIRLGMV